MFGGYSCRIRYSALCCSQKGAGELGPVGVIEDDDLARLLAEPGLRGHGNSSLGLRVYRVYRAYRDYGVYRVYRVQGI